MEIKITEKMENRINSMILIAKELSDIKKENSSCYSILKKQYFPDSSFGSNKTKDSMENLKVRLYAEIIRKQNEIKEKVKANIKG